MVVVGLDIGMTGAFAVVRDTRLLALEDLPTRNKPGSPTAHVRREIDAGQLHFRLRAALGDYLDESIAILENVRGFGGEGVASVFAFGETKGVIRGVLECLGVRVKWVEPRVWKAWFALNDDATGRKSVIKAAEIFGTDERLALVKHHNRADACLLGRYGWQKWA